MERVHAAVRDFRQLPAWSPLLIAGPDSRMEYRAAGKGYTWDGKITGTYRFLGNAWSAGVMLGRAKVYAAHRKIDAFEVYENEPAVVAENDLVTLLHFPMK